MLIVVEGKYDEEFLMQYMLYKKVNILFEIIQNGSNGLNNATITTIKKGLDDDKKVYIIFDADKSYDKTLKQIKKKLKKQLGDSADTIDIFLFPNNKDNGELETLLLKIAKQKEIVKCFECYLHCIEVKNKTTRANIEKHASIFAYKDAVGLRKHIEKIKNMLETNEIFSEYFDFDSPKLEPLREFLCRQI